MSEDVCKICMSGKLKSGLLTVSEYEKIKSEAAMYVINNGEIKLPNSVEIEDGMVSWFEYPDDIPLNNYILEIDYKGNTGLVYYFQNDYPYNIEYKALSVMDINSITRDLLNRDIDELDINLHSIIYYNGTDCPMVF